MSSGNVSKLKEADKAREDLIAEFCDTKDRNAVILISEDNIFEDERFKEWEHHFIKDDKQKKNLVKVDIGNVTYTAYKTNFTNYIMKTEAKKK